MASFSLRLSIPKKLSGASARSTFFWTNQGRSSFESSVGPRLGRLGPVAQPNVDFARLAVAVFAADRSTPREGGGSNWSEREFDLMVPVGDPALWQGIEGELGSLVGFLTGDQWRLRFVAARPPRELVSEFSPGAGRVVLLSGGADSAIGALTSRAELGDQPHILVSHVGATNLSPIQQNIASMIEALVPGPAQRHVRIGFRRRSEQPNGTKFRNEFSSRSRSLLFIALGLAVASIEFVPLWIPENGFASLNPPLGPDRRGSLSTRTTHPAFLTNLAELLSQIGAHADLVNPFAAMTKGEVFSRAAALIGEVNASGLLSATHSCGLTGQRAFGAPIRTQCGVCFGCVVRRAAFAASGLSDRTSYLDPAAKPGLAAWLEKNSVELSVRDFLRRGAQPRDIVSLSLPSGYAASEALALCQRAMDELKKLYS